MRLTKFLFIIEKVTIIIMVLIFIPIALFVYKAQKVQISDSLQKAYSTMAGQLKLSGFLTSPKNISICQSPPLQFYQLCYNRCKLGSDCSIIDSSALCFFNQSYKLGNYQLCSQQQIKNRFAQDFSLFTLDNAFSPLAHIDTSLNNVKFQHYCLAKIQDCSNAYKTFGQSIKSKFQQNHAQFLNTSTYLMYFGLIPLVGHIVFVVILDFIKKFNLRITNSLLVIHQALIGIGCIILVIKYDQRNQELSKSIKSVTNSCIIKDGSYCQKTLYQEFTSFNGSDGIASVFVTAMMFILVLQIVCLLIILIVNILLVKYYELRENHPSNDGYQLQTL